MGNLISSFGAFNTNALNHLLYNISSNLYIILLIMCAVFTITINLKEDIEISASDEQNVL